MKRDTSFVGIYNIGRINFFASEAKNASQELYS